MRSMSVPIPQLFDMRALRWNRQRAAESYDKFAFLKDEAALRLADRVDLMRRDFDLCLDLGAHDGRLSQHLAPLGKIRTIVQSDPAAKFSDKFFQRIKPAMTAYKNVTRNKIKLHCCVVSYKFTEIGLLKAESC